MTDAAGSAGAAEAAAAAAAPLPPAPDDDVPAGMQREVRYPEGGGSPYWVNVKAPVVITNRSKLTEPNDVAKYEWLHETKGEPEAERWAGLWLAGDKAAEGDEFEPDLPGYMYKAILARSRVLALQAQQVTPTAAAAPSSGSKKKKKGVVEFQHKDLHDILKQGERFVEVAAQVDKSVIEKDREYVSHICILLQWWASRGF